jgi:hypothetical protein
MKKLIILVSVLTIGAFTSCKKDYICKCQKTYTGTNGSVTVNDGQYTYKDTQPRAIDRCNANETTGSDLGGDYTRDCDIQ